MGISVVLLNVALAEENTVTVDSFQAVGINGFHNTLDSSFPGARTADAVHRSVLLRFPGSAQAIAARLAQGAAIERVEVVFDYEGYEISPPGYDVQHTQGAARWRDNPPQWHYIAWALRQPWDSRNEQLAPTFNAYVNGAGYWAKYGAQDEIEDRHPNRFGPTEVSLENPQGTMDITPVLSETQYGGTLAERLRNFEEQGLLLRKWETYDMRYNDWTSYEWAVATGAHGLTFENARLVVHLADAQPAQVQLPPARDINALAAHLHETGEGGHPTAAMPTEEEVRQFAEDFAFSQPDWMPDWQWERVQELLNLGGDTAMLALVSGDLSRYTQQVRNILASPPRRWMGWGVQNRLIMWHLYGETLPEFVRDHMRNYWEAWLMLDYPNSELMHPQGNAKLEWWREHRDWRGRFSFFRRNFTQGVSTIGFNHTAIMGALLGGAKFEPDNYAIQDGRSALENRLLRFWSYLDGTTTEFIDHYYYSITISCQKVFADFAPTHFDRMMGTMITDRGIEMLASAYHPHLRRAIGPAARVLIANMLGFQQEGGYSVLHTLSPRGVLFHTDKSRNATQHGMRLYGGDFPPGRVAIQSIAQPWLPEWSRRIVDEKPLPFEVTAAESIRGNFRNPPLWQRIYLGHYYGLGSQDLKGGSVDVQGQWHGENEPATDAEQLGTLTMRYNINQPRVAQTSGGGMPYVGEMATFQHRNRAIVLAKPRRERERTLGFAGDEGVKKLYTTVALWNFREEPGWDIYIDGEPIGELPVHLRAGQVITIRDGNAYVGIIPLPATDLGRDAEVVIEPGIPEDVGAQQRGVQIAPLLMINSYNLKQDAPIAPEGDHWERITQESTGGFVIELGDVEEHGTFEAFQRHMLANQIETEWEADARILHVKYRSGEDLMEMGYGTDYTAVPHFPVEPGQHRRALPYRRINGEDPYPRAGIERDTTLTQQGTTGRLEKNGAVLEMDEGRKGYLQTELVGGSYGGYNPFPDLTPFKFTVPGSIEILADGMLGMARVAVQPANAILWVDNAYKPEQVDEDGVAERLLVFGFDAAPTVTLNGRQLDELESIEHDGRTAFVIPLDM